MNRSNTVIAALLAAMLIPRIQKYLGVTLTDDDIAALMAAAITIFHGAGATLERYFPPPKETQSVNPQPSPSGGVPVSQGGTHQP